jgi:sulfite reductase (NADPH) flavoprotein alpha-component
LKPGSRRTGGKKFLKGTIIANINLNDRGSAKQTHHIEIGIERVDYEPGDSIGVVPVNSDKTVLEILDRVGADAEEQIEHRFGRMSMFDLLKTKLNITCLPERVVGRYAGITGNEISGERWHLSDLVKAYPVKNSEIWKEIFQSLEPIAPRLYSISSSPKAHPDEIHLTVSKSNYEAYGETRYGLCSDILTGLQVQDMQEFYIHKNHQFRLPDSEKPIVMIGPGTGIAPFRSFLSHRDASGATGYNWLFFGEQHFISDFLYQSEIQQWVQTGVLKHVHLAFSRDQADKIYVQHRIREQGREIYNWIEKGAVIYVCGSRNPMSEDVENAFRSIISEHGKRKDGQAEEFLEELKSSGRYLTDVY